MTNRRLIRIAAPTIALGLLVWGGARLMLAMNADAPVFEASALRTALGTARNGRILEFAPKEFRAAEAAAAQALSFHQRTMVETAGFMNYDLSRGLIFKAHTELVGAWRKGRREHNRNRMTVELEVAQGRAVVETANAKLASLPISSVLRTSLARAKVAARSAEVRASRGDYSGASADAATAKENAGEVLRRTDAFLEHYKTSGSAGKWDTWVRQTIDVSRRTGDYVVVVDKLKHKCHLYRGGALVRTYDADLGGTLWDKVAAGDRATPEGMYRIVRKRPKGQTTYYKALLINYPNDEDRAEFALAKRRGWVSRRAGIGGLIEIHGEGGRKEDWTLGCVALANRDMDELFRLVDVGTPVTIVGTIVRALSGSG